MDTHICPYKVPLEDCFPKGKGYLAPATPNKYHMFKACRATCQHIHQMIIGIQEPASPR